MRQNDDGKTVAAMDLLVPRVIFKIVFMLYHHQNLAPTMLGTAVSQLNH